MDPSYCILIIVILIPYKQEQLDSIRFTNIAHLRLDIAITAKDDYENRESDGFIESKKF
jgi:hypothetical protein